MEKATFGAGCFWGVESAFRQLEGVIDAAVGYSGGHTSDPSYREVCSGQTGHAEVVEVTFDPEKICFETLLDSFWKMHDPTTRNRQGPDIGTQYRSIIFFHNTHQQSLATTSKEKLSKSGRYRNPVVTEIESAQIFYRAEDYHQQYFEKNGLSSCHVT